MSAPRLPTHRLGASTALTYRVPGGPLLVIPFGTLASAATGLRWPAFRAYAGDASRGFTPYDDSACPAEVREWIADLCDAARKLSEAARRRQRRDGSPAPKPSEPGQYTAAQMACAHMTLRPFTGGFGGEILEECLQCGAVAVTGGL